MFKPIIRITIGWVDELIQSNIHGENTIFEFTRTARNSIEGTTIENRRAKYRGVKYQPVKTYVASSGLPNF